MNENAEKVKRLMKEGDFATIGEIMFPTPARRIIASSIFAACDIARSTCDQKLLMLPKRSYWREAYGLQFTIDDILTQYCEKPEIERLKFEPNEIRIPTCGFPYSEYSSDLGDFHVKKTDKKGALPEAKYQRVRKAQSNQTNLFDDPETLFDSDTMTYAIITFGHSKFNLEYVGIGFPEGDYSGWASEFIDISDSVVLSMVENIKRDKGESLREEFINQEEIQDKILVSLK